MRLFQEIDNFLYLLFGSFLSRYILESDTVGLVAFFVHLCLALSNIERVHTSATCTTAHTTHDEYPDGYNEYQWSDVPEQGTEHVAFLFVADGTSEFSFFLCLFQKLVQRLNGAYFDMYRRASAYFVGICLEYLFGILRLDEQICTIVIVGNDSITISFVYDFFEFRIGNLFVYLVFVAGKIKITNGDGNKHV